MITLITLTHTNNQKYHQNMSLSTVLFQGILDPENGNMVNGDINIRQSFSGTVSSVRATVDRHHCPLVGEWVVTGNRTTGQQTTGARKLYPIFD